MIIHWYKSKRSWVSLRTEKVCSMSEHLIKLTPLSQAVQEVKVHFFAWVMFLCATLTNPFSRWRWTDLTDWRPDENEQQRSLTCEAKGKVRQSDKLFRSGCIKVSIDHSPVWIHLINLVSLLNTPICPRHTTSPASGHTRVCFNHTHKEARRLEAISNSVILNAHKQPPHTHRPLSNVKWGLQSDTLGFTTKDCSYRMGVEELNESKYPNGKTVDPKWGITKRIWIPPTAHREAGK